MVGFFSVEGSRLRDFPKKKKVGCFRVEGSGLRVLGSRFEVLSKVETMGP